MSVKACDRAACSSIMCDHLLRGQYLCYDCRSEWRKLAEEKVQSSGDESQKLSEAEFVQLFEEFMRTPKDQRPYRKLTLDEFMNENSRS